VDRDGGLPVASKARAEQVRTVDVQRVVDVLDFVSDATMKAIDEALRLHLGL